MGQTLVLADERGGRRRAGERPGEELEPDHGRHGAADERHDGVDVSPIHWLDRLRLAGPWAHHQALADEGLMEDYEQSTSRNYSDSSSPPVEGRSGK